MITVMLLVSSDDGVDHGNGGEDEDFRKLY